MVVEDQNFKRVIVLRQSAPNCIADEFLLIKAGQHECD
jgi:hypothetical protein